MLRHLPQLPESSQRIPLRTLFQEAFQTATRSSTASIPTSINRAAELTDLILLRIVRGADSTPVHMSECRLKESTRPMRMRTTKLSARVMYQLLLGFLPGMVTVGTLQVA